MGEVFDENDLICIKKQFLCATAVKTIHWQSDVLQKLYNSSNSLLVQKLLLENSVNHPLVKKFPLKLSYQLMFLKDIISKLESNGQEVLDELYTTYCDLLSCNDTDSVTHYRHFLLNYHGTICITLSESSRLISQGTTGLCCWQASVALADWCLQNEQLIRNKHVLELGCGIGLTGLATTLCCKPSSYWFSDCHPVVLQMLQSNILLNVTKKSCCVTGESCLCNCDQTTCLENQVVGSTNSNETLKLCSVDAHKQNEVCRRSKILLKTRYNDTEIGVLNLPWEEFSTSIIELHMTPEVLLAADVVYDMSVFSSLCQTFCHLLNKRPCILFMACTVRSKETLDSFIKLLKTECLDVFEEKLLPAMYFYYSTEVPIKLYRITSRQ